MNSMVPVSCSLDSCGSVLQMSFSYVIIALVVYLHSDSVVSI